MKETLSIQALVVAIIVVPAALAAETPASSNNASVQGLEASQRYADYYRNLRDVAGIAVSNAPPGREAKSGAPNGPASAAQHKLSAPFGSGQLANQVARREAAGRQGSRLDRGPLGIMQSSISLSDEQVRKLEPVFKEKEDKINALRRDVSLSRKAKVAKLKEIQQGTDAKIKAHLTPEQADKWQKLRHGQGPVFRQQGQSVGRTNAFSIGPQGGSARQGVPTWSTHTQRPPQAQAQPATPQPAQK